MEQNILLLATIFIISINWIYCGTPTFIEEGGIAPKSVVDILCPLCEDVYVNKVPPSKDDNCDPSDLERSFSKSVTNDSVVTIGACRGTIIWKGFQGWSDFRVFPERPPF